MPGLYALVSTTVSCIDSKCDFGHEMSRYIGLQQSYMIPRVEVEREKMHEACCTYNQKQHIELHTQRRDSAFDWWNIGSRQSQDAALGSRRQGTCPGAKLNTIDY